MHYTTLNQALGNIDIYLLDQILKGRFQKPMRLLDAGCGEGRNLIYFIRNGFETWGVDRDASALRMLCMMGKSLHPDFDPEKFIEDELSRLPFPPESFDGVISSAVLHFADHTEAFWQMFQELWRVLRREGLLFIRMASLFGMEAQAKQTGEGRYYLPDGSERFLLTRPLLEQLTRDFSFHWIEPLKTVLVEDARSMSTLVLRKS